jgi:hypothetical protein
MPFYRGKRRIKPLNYSKNMIKSRINQIHGGCRKGEGLSGSLQK